MNAIANHRTCTLALALAIASLPSVAVAAEHVTIVSEADAARVVQPMAGGGRVPGYPENFANKSEDACVSIGYQINVDGTTSEFTMLKAWGATTPKEKKPQTRLDPLAQSAVAAIQGWRFGPVEGAKPKAYFTSATFVFTSNAATDKAELRKRCEIPRLAAFIANAKQDAYDRGNIQKGQMDRARVQNPPEIPMR